MKQPFENFEPQNSQDIVSLPKDIVDFLEKNWEGNLKNY
jgi:hypothetical protein